jgi:hypothetical protein
MTIETPDVEAEPTGNSRRQFLAKAGVAGALVWAAPTIVGLDSRAMAAVGSGCPPVFKDSIQSETPGGPTTGPVGGFTVSIGNVDVVGPGFFSELVPAGYTNGVDLDGSASQNTVLTSPLIGTGTYVVSVTLSGDRRGDGGNMATATLGLGNVSRSLASDEGPETVTFEVTLTVPSALTISHDSGTADYQGMILLAASVTPKDCTV